MQLEDDANWGSLAKIELLKEPSEIEVSELIGSPADSMEPEIRSSIHEMCEDKSRLAGSSEQKHIEARVNYRQRPIVNAIK